MAAMRSLVGMLKRRLVGSAPATLNKEKPRNVEPQKVLDDAFLEELRQTYRPLIEESRRRSQEELWAYRRKSWLIAIAVYGTVGYLGTCVVRALPTPRPRPS